MRHADARRSAPASESGRTAVRIATDPWSRRDSRQWAGPVFVVLLAATLPVLASPALRASGWLPDVAVLAVVAAGFRGTPDRAAMLGVVVGLLASLWAPEPVLLRPCLLGVIGYAASHVAIVLDRERWSIRMASVALAVLLMRGAEFVAAALAGAAPGSGAEAVDAFRAAIASAAVAAAVAPLWFGVLARWRLLGPLERSFRDV